LVLDPEIYTSVSEAFNRLASLTRVLPRVERVGTRQSYGRVLAEDVVPEIDLPARSVSQMDGYAVNADSLSGASEKNPAKLRIKGEILLGEVPKRRLAFGEAIRLPTGGFIPEGANAVVPVERTTIDGDFVVIPKYHSRGSFVYPKGADVKKGRQILQKGRQLRPQDIGLLLSLGITEVGIYRKPKVSIIATGNELTDSPDAITKGLIPNSHGFVVARLVEEMGGVAVNLGVVKDDVKMIARRIAQALAKTDIVATIGGTSLGSLDLVGEALSKFVRPSHIIHGIKMDRGRVAGVTVVRGKPVIMLPGPIQGAMNAFIIFVAPMIRAIGGRDTKARVPLRATLTEAWEARRRFPYFTKVVYVKLTLTDHGPKAKPILGETESMTTLTEANGYVIVHEEKTEIPKGGKVEVHLLPGFSYLADRFLD